MAWEGPLTTCTASNSTPTKPAICICGPTEVGGEIIGNIYGFACTDCGMWGWTGSASTTTNVYGCCSLEGSVYEIP